MSRWTHPQCERCWISQEQITNADGTTSIRRPTRVLDAEATFCCWCQSLTISGIYRRADPAELPNCTGDHDD